MGFACGELRVARKLPSCLPSSFRDHQQLPAGVLPLPGTFPRRFARPPLPPAPPCPCPSPPRVPGCLLSPAQLRRRGLAIFVFCEHIHMQSWGPSYAPLTHANSHSRWVFQEKRTNLGRQLGNKCLVTSQRLLIMDKF